ncbi:hypothetical protein BH10BAC5_BH10BAC5_24020 [soil metagenome]
MNRICPYCQSKIKDDAEAIFCELCHTPHHLECYDFNGGCTTYGCRNNPNSEKEVEIESSSAHINDDALRQQLQPQGRNEPGQQLNTNPEDETFPCPNCRRDIEIGSVFCKHCGIALKASHAGINDRPYINPPLPPPVLPVTRKSQGSNKLPLILIISGLFLLAALTYSGYYIYKNIDQHFKSVDYTVEKTIDDWIAAWEKEDIVKYRTFLTSDYEYYDTDGKAISLADRMKRLEWTFQNYKNIKIRISDMKIYKDSDTTTDLKVVFKQKYDSDQYKVYGTKTLRLYRLNSSDTNWKIYREFFEE